MKKRLLTVITALFVGGCSVVSSGGSSFNVISRSDDALRFNGKLAVGYGRSAYINDSRELIRISSDNLAGVEGTVLLENVESVTACPSYTAAVTTGHELYLWGGVPDIGKNISFADPQMVMTDVKEVSVCDQFALAVTMDDKLYGLGYKSQSIRKLMDDVKHVRAVSRGMSYDRSDAVAYISSEDELYMWGNNEGGEMGNDTGTYAADPVKIADSIQDIAIGPYYSILLKTDNTLQAIGNYDEKQKDIVDKERPTEAEEILLNQIKEGMGDVAGIGTFGYKFLVLDKSGNLYCYGEDAYDSNPYNGLVAEKVKFVATNPATVMYMTENYDLYAFGNNLDSQFGHEIQSYSQTPQFILNINDQQKSADTKNSAADDSDSKNISYAGECGKLTVLKETDVYEEASLSSMIVKTLNVDEQYPIYDFTFNIDGLWMNIGDSMWVSTKSYDDTVKYHFYAADAGIEKYKYSDQTGLLLDQEIYYIPSDRNSVLPLYYKNPGSVTSISSKNEEGNDHVLVSLGTTDWEVYADDLHVGYYFLTPLKKGTGAINISVNGIAKRITIVVED